MATLDSEERRDLPCAEHAFDVRNTPRELELVRVGLDDPVRDVDLLELLRHWHENEDELVYVIAGEVVLAENDGETVLRAGDAAGFKAGVANGHHLVNRSGKPATILEIGSRFADERAHYPDDDLAYHKEGGVVRFTRKDGSAVE